MPQEQQNIRRWLVRLTGPIFIEMVLIILLGIVDTVMLSQCSDNTVAAVGVVVQLLNMIFLVFEATTAGTSVLCSQFLGARQMDNVFRAIGVSLAFNMMMGVIIIGNYTLIFGHFGFPALGVEGAAISTSFSRGVAMCLLLFILFRKKLTFPPSFLWPFPFGVLRKMLSIGLPSGGEQLSYSLSQVVITYFVNMLGNEALAARTYAVNIVTFSYVFAMSVGQGGGICIGHLIGKGHKNAALLLGRYCIRITLMISFSVALLSALLGKSVMGLLSDNPEVVSLTALILCIDVVLELGRAVNILCVNFLRATGDAVYPFIIGLIFMWGVATVGGYVLGVTLGFGLVGMWIAFTMDESIRAALFWRRWQSRRWMGKSIVAR